MRHSFSMQNFTEAFLAQRGAGSDDGGSHSLPLLTSLLREERRPVLRLLMLLPDALQWVRANDDTTCTRMRFFKGDRSMADLCRNRAGQRMAHGIEGT